MKIRPFVFGQASPAPTFVIHVGADEIHPIIFGQASPAPTMHDLRIL